MMHFHMTDLGIDLRLVGSGGHIHRGIDTWLEIDSFRK